MESHLELWSDFEAAGGSKLGAVDGVESGSIRRRVGDRWSGALSVVRQAAWLDELTFRTVLRVDDHLGVTTEWLVPRIQDVDGPSEILTVQLEPASDILRRAGVLSSNPPGVEVFSPNRQAAPFLGLGMEDGTIPQFWETFVAPRLAAAGYAFVELGTVDDTESVFTLSWERWTARQLTSALSSAADLEAAVRREGGAAYKVDFVNQVGAGAEKVMLQVGRNLRQLERDRDARQAASWIVPTTPTPRGYTERPGIGQASWEVTAVSGSSPSGTVQVQARNSGRGPIHHDGHLEGHYLKRVRSVSAIPTGDPTDATLTEILSTDAATQTFTVRNPSDFEVGDDVEVRLTENGALMYRLHSEANVAELGYIEGAPEIAGRPERNWTPNPYAEDWDPEADVLLATVKEDAFSVDEVTLEGLEEGDVIAARDRIVNLINSQWFRVTSGDTANASGEVTLTLHQNVSWGEGNQVAIVRTGGREPDGWTNVDTAGNHIAVTVRDRTHFGSLSPRKDGAAGSSRPDNWNYALKSLAEGDVIQVGDVLVHPNGERSMVLVGGTADANGDVTVDLRDPLESIDNLELTLLRFPLAGRGSPGNVPVLLDNQTPGAECKWISDVVVPTRIVRQEQGRPKSSTVHVAVGIDMVVASGTSNVTISESDAPVVRLADGEDAADADATDTTGEVTVPVDEALSVTLHAEVELGEPENAAARKDYRLQLRPPARSDVVTFLRWAMMWVGPAGQVPPPVWGSHATRVYQRALDILDDAGRLRVRYGVDMVDLTAALGSGESLTLGGDARVVSEPLNVDTDARVVDLEIDLVDSERTRVGLDVVRERISRAVARSRRRGQFTVVRSPGQNGEPAEESLAETTEEPPLEVAGAGRALAAGGGLVINIEPLEN